MRKSQHLSVRELGEKSGIEAEKIRMFETGRKHPSIPALIKLAKALNCKVSDIREKRKEAT